MKAGAIINYTTKKLHSKPNGKPVEVCPECGRKGEHTTFTGKHEGKETFIHKVRWSGLFFIVLESCYINNTTK